MSLRTLPRALPDPAVEPTIKAERVAAVLGVSVRAAYAAIERGEVPSIRVGRLVRVPTARFLAQYDLSEPVSATVVEIADRRGPPREVA